MSTPNLCESQPPPPPHPPNEKKSPGVSNNGSHITWITPNHMHWNGLIHILNVSKYIVAEREKQSLYHDQQIRVFILSYFLCNSIILIHFFPYRGQMPRCWYAS